MDLPIDLARSGQAVDPLIRSWDRGWGVQAWIARRKRGCETPSRNSAPAFFIAEIAPPFRPPKPALHRCHSSGSYDKNARGALLTTDFRSPHFTSQCALFDLGVKPSELPGGNYWTEKGARLLDGNFAPTWDWWSGSFYQGDASQYIPQADEESPVVIYRWKQLNPNPEESLVLPGQEYMVPEGYFRFSEVEIGGKKEVMIVSVSTAGKGGSASLTGMGSVVTPYTHGGLEWNFGSTFTRAVLRGGKLIGATYPAREGNVPLFGWEAVPVTGFDDAYVSSLASISMEELASFTNTVFRYQPVAAREEPSVRRFLTLPEYLKEAVIPEE